MHVIENEAICTEKDLGRSPIHSAQSLKVCISVSLNIFYLQPFTYMQWGWATSSPNISYGPHPIDYDISKNTVT